MMNPGTSIKQVLFRTLAVLPGSLLQPSAGKPRDLKVLETLTLAPKTQLMLVGLRDQRFLIGVGPQGISSMLTLAPATSPQAAELPGLPPQGRVQ